MADNFSKSKVMECNKTYCMKNIDGKCVHRICPMENPDYEMPHAVASRKEMETKAHNEAMKQIRNEVKKTKKSKENG